MKVDEGLIMNIDPGSPRCVNGRAWLRQKLGLSPHRCAYKHVVTYSKFSFNFTSIVFTVSVVK